MPTPFKQDLYDRLVDAFRVEPGNITRAAKVAGCSRPTSRKGWEHGWRGVTNAPPIKDFLYQEQEAIRAQRAKAEQERMREEIERQILARKDAAETRREEAIASRTSRRNAIKLALVSARLLESMDAMAQELTARVKNGLAAMRDDELRKWISMGALTTHRAEAVLKLALQIERVVAGEPEATLAVKVEGMSAPDMVRELAGLSRTFMRAQKLAPHAMGESFERDDVEEKGGTN